MWWEDLLPLTEPVLRIGETEHLTITFTYMYAMSHSSLQKPAILNLILKGLPQDDLLISQRVSPSACYHNLKQQGRRARIPSGVRYFTI